MNMKGKRINEVKKTRTSVAVLSCDKIPSYMLDKNGQPIRIEIEKNKYTAIQEGQKIAVY
jgi:hypothetical protein